MSVKFKELKYKHFRQAKELNDLVHSGEIKEEDILKFAVSLVKEWDFIDVETGEALQLGEIDELSQSQFTEVFDAFSKIMSGDSQVPKEKAAV